MCSSEEEARQLINKLPKEKKWPCLFSKSDTTGEKDFEEFFTNTEKLELNRFENLGIIKNELINNDNLLIHFENSINKLKTNLKWSKEDIVYLFHTMIPDFGHKETGKYLDTKM